MIETQVPAIENFLRKGSDFFFSSWSIIYCLSKSQPLMNKNGLTLTPRLQNADPEESIQYTKKSNPNDSEWERTNN